MKTNEEMQAILLNNSQFLALNKNCETQDTINDDTRYIVNIEESEYIDDKSTMKYLCVYDRCGEADYIIEIVPWWVKI